MNRHLVKNFLKTLEKNPAFTVMKVKKNNRWQNISRENLYNNIIQCRSTLNDFDILKGDRVAFKGKNSVEWLSWNIACQSLGVVWVPMYEQQTANQCQYIVNDCQPKLLITNENIDIKHTNIISPEINKNEHIHNTFYFQPNELSTLIYTSGTTGNPKGVMLTQDNILSNITGIRQRFSDIQVNTTSLSILPWAHIYGLTCELYYNLLYDNTTAICSDKTKFTDECKEIKPHVLYIVPKLLEHIKSKTQFLDLPIVNKSLPFILNRLFGNNLLNLFVGGAKLDKNTFSYFNKNGILICEGYGCSETSPMVSVNHLYHSRDENSVGKILDNVNVEIIDGEICVSGPNVMNGYWNDDELTNKVLIKHNNNSYYKTGDSGYINNDFLFYTGRISDNYKMSNGKFVNVALVEAEIKKHILNNFIIYGENMDYSVLIVEEPFEDKLLKTINTELESYMKIKKVIKITTEKMADYLTPKMSIKRKALIEYVKDKI